MEEAKQSSEVEISDNICEGQYQDFTASIHKNDLGIDPLSKSDKTNSFSGIAVYQHKLAQSNNYNSNEDTRRREI